MTFSCLETSATSPKTKKSRLLKKKTSFHGIGLFTGKDITLTLLPSDQPGIFFQRMDLPDKPLIPALASFVKETPRCTILEKEGVCIRSPEHILSALKAFEIYDAMIQINGEEPPVGDGSARHFVDMIEEAGIEEIEKYKKVYQLKTPLYFSKGNSYIIALPHETFEMSYTLHYPNSKLLEAQFFSSTIDEVIFKKEISCARTFSFYEEVLKLKEAGFLDGITLENGVVIQGEKVLNPDGLRFSNEGVRHKALDLIGDLALVGSPFDAHIISIGSGHFLNTTLAQMLCNHFREEKLS